MSDYELQDELGRGAMGTVHRARQRGLDRIVALKRVVAPFGMEASSDYLARFRHEALAMSKVSHPNLVRVFGCGDMDGVPFIAMELVDGVPLERMVLESPVEVRRQADALFAQILKAVAALHHAKLVHRDLKPGNIMVERGGRAVVMDLGLVKDLAGDGTRLTGTGDCVGTPRYLSPEVVLGEPASFASDVWALGCIYYEMNAGRALIDGTGLGEVMRAIAAYQIPDLDRACPDLPAERLGLLERMVARDPKERPRDAARVLALFEGPRPPRASRRVASSPNHAAPASGEADRTPPGARSRRAAGVLAIVALIAVGALALRPTESEPARAPSAVASATPAPGPAPDRAAGNLAERDRTARLAAERAKLAAMIDAVLVAAPPDQEARAAELVDACVNAPVEARPNLTGPVAQLCSAVVLSRAGAMKQNVIEISFSVVAGEKRAEHLRMFRRAVDALCVVMRLVDVSRQGGLTLIGIRGGFLLGEHFRRIDQRTTDRLEASMRELSLDPDRGYAALLALAHQDHTRGAHTRELSRRGQALASYERRWMPQSSLAKGDVADCWYRILLSFVFCKSGPRHEQLARLERQLAAGDARIAPGDYFHRKALVDELAAFRR